MKVSELIGVQLDSWVAKAADVQTWEGDIPKAADWHGNYEADFEPSTNWEHGGPIIERERIQLRFNGIESMDPEGWWASVNPIGEDEWVLTWRGGPTPLIAAMRAYVASKFGDEVEG